MGFLHKLWDETLAGPAPESGLGKLRKYDSFPASRSAPVVSPSDAPMNITRSITIVKSNKNSTSPRFVRNISVETAGSPPESPLGSSTPGTPTSREFGSRILLPFFHRFESKSSMGTQRTTYGRWLNEPLN